MANDEPPTNGTAGVRIAYDLPVWMAISAFTAVAWYNVAQLNISIFMTFKRRRGLYFWSLLVSSYGCIFHSVGFLLKLFQLTHNDYVSCTIITLGWWPMVTGQSLVLYSRLHLVVKEQKILRGVLIMIIWNAITLHMPTTVFTYGSSTPAWRHFIHGFAVMEKIQMTIFCCQELIISGIYMWATVRLLKPVYRRRTRSVMQQLIWINGFIIIMDISLLVLEYLGYYQLEATLKHMVYSIKLTLEFSVLNQLMRLANSNNAYNIGVREDEMNQSKKRRRPFRYITKFLPHHAPFQDEKTCNAKTPPSDSMNSATCTYTSSGLSHGRKESFDYIDTNESQTPPLNERKPSNGKRPSLAVDTASLVRQRQVSNASTIYNNPAAFAKIKRPSRDPYSLEGLSPVTSTPLAEFVDSSYNFPGLQTRNPFQRPRPRLPRLDMQVVNSTNHPGASHGVSVEVSHHAYDRPERDHTSLDLSPHQASDSPSSHTSRFSALFTLPQRFLDPRESPPQSRHNTSPSSPSHLTPPDPNLLISHRPSVSDWPGYRVDSTESRASSEERLDPTERIKRSTLLRDGNRPSAVEQGKTLSAANREKSKNVMTDNEHGGDADGEVSEGESPLVDDEVLSSPEDDEQDQRINMELEDLDHRRIDVLGEACRSVPDKKQAGPRRNHH